MEHPCQHCGTTVEDGRPFCPQCRAPQIHVQIADPDVALAAGLHSAPEEFSPEILQTRHFGSLGTTPGNTLDRGATVRAAIEAGVLGVFVGMIPLLGIVLTGALAVYFYRRHRGVVLPAALGWRLGGAAGVVAFVINALLITIRIFVFHARQEYIDGIVKVAQAFGGNAADPDVQAAIRSLFTPSGLTITLLLGMILTVVLASAGGALASLFMRSGKPRM